MQVGSLLQGQLQGLKAQPPAPQPLPELAQIDSVDQGRQALERLAAGEDLSGRLAAMAMKAFAEGDCTLADLGQAPVPLLQEPLAAVVQATLAQLSAGPTGSVVALAARTGLDALERVSQADNPMGPALAAEPFVIGIAEQSEENEEAARLCEFLQSEVPAMLTHPAREAYRVVLQGLSQEAPSSADSLLAAAGSAALSSMPGHEADLAPLVTTFLEELGSSESPLVASYADEVADLGQSYLKDDEKKKVVGELYSQALRTLAEVARPELTAQSFLRGAAGLLESLPALPVSAEERTALAESVTAKVGDEAGSPLLELLPQWVAQVPEEARLSLQGGMLRALAERPDLPPTELPALALRVAEGHPQAAEILTGFVRLLAEEMGEELAPAADLEGLQAQVRQLQEKLA